MDSNGFPKMIANSPAGTPNKTGTSSAAGCIARRRPGQMVSLEKDGLQAALGYGKKQLKRPASALEEAFHVCEVRDPREAEVAVPMGKVAQTCLFRRVTRCAHVVFVAGVAPYIHTPHSTLSTLHSPPYTVHFTHLTPHSTLYIHTLHSTVHTLHFTL